MGAGEHFKTSRAMPKRKSCVETVSEEYGTDLGHLVGRAAAIQDLTDLSPILNRDHTNEYNHADIKRTRVSDVKRRGF